jgi:flagellar motor protein MotB
MVGNRSGRFVVVAAGLTLALALGGCKQNRLQDERNALYKQNIEGQNELNRTRAALEAAENDRTTTAAELARLKAEKEAADRAADDARRAAEAARAAAETNRNANTGFEGVGEGVTAERTTRGVEVNIPGDVLFASGKADLTANAKKTLAKVAKALNSAEHKGHNVRVEGHTDTDPIRRSKWKDNQQLSEARADAVAAYLQSQGVAGGRLSTVGYGSTQPKATKALSRRVEVVVLK